MVIFSLCENATYKSDVEKGDNLMLTRQAPVATLALTAGEKLRLKIVTARFAFLRDLDEISQLGSSRHFVLIVTLASADIW